MTEKKKMGGRRGGQHRNGVLNHEKRKDEKVYRGRAYIENLTEGDWTVIKDKHGEIRVLEGKGGKSGRRENSEV